MSPCPRRVRCEPLGDGERVGTVVEETVVADTRGPRIRLTVAIEGHRYRVFESDTEPACPLTPDE